MQAINVFSPKFLWSPNPFRSGTLSLLVKNVTINKSDLSDSAVNTLVPLLYICSRVIKSILLCKLLTSGCLPTWPLALDVDRCGLLVEHKAQRQTP